MIQNASVVFIIVVMGYVLLSRSNQYRHRLLTNSKHVVLYESAFVGGSLFTVVFVVLEALKLNLLHCTSMRVEGFEDMICSFDSRYPLPFLDVQVLCAIIVGLGIWGGNARLSDREVGVQIARKTGLIATVVLDALDEDHLIQITTTRGKVYVGWIFLGPGISGDGKIEDVAIAPLASGHRNTTTQKAILDIDYSVALDIFAEEVNKEDEHGASQLQLQQEMSVVIPMGELALIRRYNQELAKVFGSIAEDDYFDTVDTPDVLK